MTYTEEELKNLHIDVTGKVNFSREDFTIDGKTVAQREEMQAVQVNLERHASDVPHLSAENVVVIANEALKPLEGRVENAERKIDDLYTKYEEGPLLYVGREEYIADKTAFGEAIAETKAYSVEYTNERVAVLRNEVLDSKYATETYVRGQVEGLDTVFRKLIKDCSEDITEVREDLEATKEAIPVKGTDYLDPDAVTGIVEDKIHIEHLGVERRFEVVEAIANDTHIRSVSMDEVRNTLAKVAFSGDYADLNGKPVIPSLQDYCKKETVEELFRVHEKQLKEYSDAGDAKVEEELKAYIDGREVTDLKSMHFKGRVQSLPEGEVVNGDTFTVGEDDIVGGDTFVRNGEAWVQITPDTSRLQSKAEAEAQYIELRASIATVDAKVGETDDPPTSVTAFGKIAALDAEVKEVKENYATVKYVDAEVTKLDAKIDNIESEVGTIKADVAVLRQKVESAPSREDLEGIIDTVREMLDQYETVVDFEEKHSIHDARIAALERRVNDEDPQTYATKQEVYELKHIVGRGINGKNLTSAVADIVASYPFTNDETALLKQMASILSWRTTLETESGEITDSTVVAPDGRMAAIREQLAMPVKVFPYEGGDVVYNMTIPWVANELNTVFVDTLNADDSKQDIKLVIKFKKSPEETETSTYEYAHIAGGRFTRLYIWYTMEGEEPKFQVCAKAYSGMDDAFGA